MLEETVLRLIFSLCTVGDVETFSIKTLLQKNIYFHNTNKIDRFVVLKSWFKRTGKILLSLLTTHFKLCGPCPVTMKQQIQWDENSYIISTVLRKHGRTYFLKLTWIGSGKIKISKFGTIQIYKYYSFSCKTMAMLFCVKYSLCENIFFTTVVSVSIRRHTAQKWVLKKTGLKLK